ncbi:ATP-binding cassette sub-family G member 1 [Tribolium castaneum]|uniref:Protein white-like Protein n=1 Tax=Tribolium castaneum TaxID=7070 RepID=D2A233_TRICA|nr:PREDICTED: ATP-binding cassette sub-family G member 1 [Tribolium castaneum]EFA01493.1 Protein white-like Protein [Tribolium castaneum]|eukprot:XP_973526.1 PREDICTED: ATP-binding cassette sub-family G member 1 [Tribolium castaneum]
MEKTTSTPSLHSKFLKRPDSLQLELLPIPEDGPLAKYQQSSTGLVHVGFKDLTYTVKEGILRRKPRDLLRKVNGEFSAGELTAIMGPSGAGKSTLMNILAGYTRSGVAGKLLVNGEEREESTFRKQSCYIMQNDNLQPLLTVHEAMTVAANLKLSARNTHREKQSRVKEILESINLWQNRKVKTCSLSGGQKKRLSIALELLKNPQVMFFDEPTSGLDSLTSKQCVMLLKQIASTGRTVICTIHQPSAMIFEMFDHLYAVANGYCIYQGTVEGLLPYLEQSNLKCPPYHNPADYLLEVASGDYGDFTEILVKQSDNGLNQEWRNKQRNSLQFQSLDHIDKLMESGQITPVKAPPILFKKITNGNAKEATFCGNSQYPTSFCNQIYVLLKRTFLLISRDRTLTYSRISTHLGIALFIGTLYHGIGEDASNVLNNFNFLFFSVMFLMLTAFNCVTTTFPSELPIITREHFNKWYSLKSYYLAITLADIPIQMVATLLYAIVTYFLTMQPVEAFRIFSFLFMCVLISLVAQSFGLFIGAIMDIKNGVIFGPFCFLPFTIFSGFFVQLNDSHPYMRWLFHISFLKYGLEGLVLSVLGYDRGKLPCSADYCHFVYPEKFLDQMDMEYAQYSTAVIFMLSLVAIIRIAAYFALSLQIKKRT